MEKLIYPVVGFLGVAMLGAASIGFGGQNQQVFGVDFFAPIMSLTALFLAFSLPEASGLYPSVGLLMATVFLLQFVVLKRNRRVFRGWTVMIAVVASLLSSFQFLDAWRFASDYYGSGPLLVCALVSTMIMTLWWLAIFRVVNGIDAQADARLNIMVFYGLAWGALPYLGELP
jgi:hypothetical protein